MKDSFLLLQDPICALATPPGRGALAIIRCSGKASIALLAPFFSAPGRLLKGDGHTLHYGRIIDPIAEEVVDEVLISLFHSPQSYTGEESVEITCHGGEAVTRRILKLLTDNGFRPAQRGEFTYRACRSGKIDLTKAEGIRQLTEAATEAERKLGIGRLSGNISSGVQRLYNTLLSFLGTIEIQLDYPEDEVPDMGLPQAEMQSCLTTIKDLLATRNISKVFNGGFRVVIVGEANAGKSSLFNALTKEQRAIVSAEPGTTRDYLEAFIEIEGVKIRLFDTAGLREQVHGVEAEGIQKMVSLAVEADLIIHLLDPTTQKTPPEKLPPGIKTNGEILKVWNKGDIANLSAIRQDIVISAVTGMGISTLLKAIGEHLPSIPSKETPVISEREENLLLTAQKKLISAIKANNANEMLEIIAEDLKDALQALSSLCGKETYSEDLLDSLFSTFCVGK